jgi:exportin-T
VSTLVVYDLTYLNPPTFTGNAPHFEAIVAGVAAFAMDTSDPVSQKGAFTLLSRFTTHFGSPLGTKVEVPDRAKPALGGKQPLKVVETHHVPGFEQFIYERLIPMAFEVPAAPGFNIKDGQSVAVSSLGLLCIS